MPLELLHNTVIDGNLTLTNNGDLSVRGIAASGNVRLTGVGAATQGTAVMIDSNGNLSKRLLGSLAYSSATIPTNNNQLTNGAGYITRADNFYLDGISKSGNVLTFSVNGAANQQYTFGANAFNSTTIPTNNNQLTNGRNFITGLSFANLSSKTGGTGDYSTNGDLVSGRGSGGVALTINDGKGNANVTFNHQNGVPEQNGNAARIEVNTDSSSGAHMSFELGSGVTGGTSTGLNTAAFLSETSLDIPYRLRHYGDSNTYLQFDADRIRLFAGGNLWLDSNNPVVNTNYYLDGISKSGNTLTFSVNGTTNQTYTFGSNAFNSTTIPTNNNQLTNGAGYTTFDGNYNSLTNKPTIPTNNNQLTNGAGYITSYVNNYLDGITKSGNDLEFSVRGATNQSFRFGSNAFNSTTIPTNNNQLTNGAGYTTFDGNYNSLSNRPTIPTNNNQLTNGAGYVTSNGFVDSASFSTTTGVLTLSGRNLPSDVTVDLDGRYLQTPSSLQQVTNAGNSTSNTISAPRYNDYNSSTYYLDPSSASRMNDINVNYLDVQANNAYALRFWGGSTNYAIRMSQATNSTYGGRVPGETTSDYNMYFRMSGGTNRGFVFQNGTREQAGIDGGGNFRTVGNVIAYSSSDKRLKDNIIPIKGALDIVNSMGGYKFDWNEEKQDTFKGKDVGVIAQEVKELVPEIVTEREDGMLAVKYEKLVPVLIEAIKELTEEVNDLKYRLDNHKL